MIQRIHKINRPLEIGEVVIAPTVQDVVVIWPPHDDKECGQPEKHYHVDPRFGETTTKRITKTDRGQWIPRTVTSEFVIHKFDTVGEATGTRVDFIVKAIRPRNKMINGKCPHKGFNLMQVKPINGVIHCPLHSMRFWSFSGNGMPHRKYKEVDEDYLVRIS